MRHALLVAVYYLAVTPWGWWRRRFGDPLALRPDPDAATYWRFTEQAGGRPGEG
ncbi:hypothetical protein [Streptomyces sp. UNOC14_S4]|uniref:hypothetical protein n=1 Tax=Streptomyces sp. UNOC14_S4 TaxID=2872340 RepID=UPI001E5B8C36|nr:hypothetical protein [Streptomyces sp. UNOC14_S4]MCC3769261.1 hypothetical protein [Streptomyces sp. UNOC14_S4]